MGLDDEDRFDVDARDALHLLDDPDDERCIPMDPEEVLNGEHDRLVNEIGGEESWRIQEIRAETAARAGYIGVRDRDEQGDVIMVAPHEIQGDLNDRLFYVAQDPRHRENRTPEMEAADSWGEEMRLQIDERLEREKNVDHAEIGREAGSDLVAGRKIKLMDVTQEDADQYDAFVAENAVPFEMSKEQRDRIAEDVGLEVVDPDELMRRGYLIERSEELRHEMTPDLPEGYQLRVEAPGPEDRPDHPVGVLRGPDDFEERYQDVSKEDEPRIETAALTHQDRVRHREADRAEIGDRGRKDDPSQGANERVVAR